MGRARTAPTGSTAGRAASCPGDVRDSSVQRALRLPLPHLSIAAHAVVCLVAPVAAFALGLGGAALFTDGHDGAPPIRFLALAVCGVVAAGLARILVRQLVPAICPNPHCGEPSAYRRGAGLYHYECVECRYRHVLGTKAGDPAD